MNALMLNSGSPRNLWGKPSLQLIKYSIEYPIEKIQSIPYELWKEKKPNLKYFKVRGCLAKVEVPLPKRVKIAPKTIDCVFIGYVVNSKACRFLVHKSDNPEIHVNTIIESDNA